jgi:hypothetical protein
MIARVFTLSTMEDRVFKFMMLPEPTVLYIKVLTSNDELHRRVFRVESGVTHLCLCGIKSKRMPYVMRVYRTDKLFLEASYGNGMKVYYLTDRDQLNETRANLNALIRAEVATATRASPPVKKFPGHLMDQVYGRIDYCECDAVNE